MKRRKRPANSQKKKSNQRPAHSATTANKRSRRDFLATVSNFGLLAAAGGGASWYLMDEVCATTREHDLTRIGNGIPAVVQIHDPECSICAALQREARKAVANFGDDELQFLVANIRQQKGRNLANKHRVRHITLLIFDGKGNRRAVLTGPNTSENLTEAFKSYAKGAPAK